MQLSLTAAKWHQFQVDKAIHSHASLLRIYTVYYHYKTSNVLGTLHRPKTVSCYCWKVTSFTSLRLSGSEFQTVGSATPTRREYCADSTVHAAGDWVLSIIAYDQRCPRQQYVKYFCNELTSWSTVTSDFMTGPKVTRTRKPSHLLSV